MSAGGAPPQCDRGADRISLRRSCATPKELIFDLAPGPPPPSGLQTECDNEGSLVANRSTVGTSWTVLKPLWGSLRTGQIEAKLIEKQEAQGGVGSRGLNSPCSGGGVGSLCIQDVYRRYPITQRTHFLPPTQAHRLELRTRRRGPGALITLHARGSPVRLQTHRYTTGRRSHVAHIAAQKPGFFLRPPPTLFVLEHTGGWTPLLMFSTEGAKHPLPPPFSHSSYLLLGFVWVRWEDHAGVVREISE